MRWAHSHHATRPFTLAIALSLCGALPAGAGTCTDSAERRLVGAEGDASSARCLSCHDGTLAPAVSNRVGLNHGWAAGQFGFDDKHPVDFDYWEAYSRNPRELRHPDSIDPRVLLPKGRVECTSCHDTSSRGRAHLVMSNRGSALCGACHDK